MADNKLVNFSIIFIAVVLLGIVLKTFAAFLRPLAIAVILTFLLMPLMRFSKKIKIPFFVTVISIIMLLIVILGVFGYLLVGEKQKIYNEFPNKQEVQVNNTINNISDIIGKANKLLGTDIDIRKIVKPDRIGAIISGGVEKGAIALGTLISELLLVIIFTIFLIPSHESLIRNIKKDIGRNKAMRVTSALLKIEQSVRDYLMTKTLISLGTAIVSAIVLLIFRADLVIVLAFLIFAMNYIPNIGSIVAVMIALLAYLFQNGITWNILWLGIILTIIQIIFGNIIEPKVAGQKLKLSPILILISLFLWFWIWGVIGMILAIPLTSILKIILEHIDSTKTIAKFMS